MTPLAPPELRQRAVKRLDLSPYFDGKLDVYAAIRVSEAELVRLREALENLCGDVYLYGLREITELQLRESSGKAQDVLRGAALSAAPLEDKP